MRYEEKGGGGGWTNLLLRREKKCKKKGTFGTNVRWLVRIWFVKREREVRKKQNNSRMEERRVGQGGLWSGRDPERGDIVKEKTV